jgi:hypothetical protein
MRTIIKILLFYSIIQNRIIVGNDTETKM